MDPLGELVHATSLRLEDLLSDLDEPDKERQLFLDDTRQFFEQRLSIYVKRRNELEDSIKKLLEHMYELCDELQVPRIIIDDTRMTLIEKRKYINEKINELKSMIIERDKQLTHLRQLIKIRAKLLGNIHIDNDEVSKLSYF